METLADTLVDRVDQLIDAGKEPIISSTPTSVAIQELLYRNEALEHALREIAREVRTLSNQLDA